jgi:GTPase SAR1 family protein
VNEETLFPAYIKRAEEDEICQEAAQVREDGKSRAVLLYGPGGVGKTQLVRRLVRAGAEDPMTVWLGPVDIDDSEYWLLSGWTRKTNISGRTWNTCPDYRATPGRGWATRRW